MTEIQAIETTYGGARFRSRLEARWAVFFDHLGIPWEHEPEAYRTSAGAYLPDFSVRIPQPKGYGDHQWFEVKPDGAPSDARHVALAAETRQPIIVARGMPRSSGDQIGTPPRYDSMLILHLPGEAGVGVEFADETTGLSGYCGLGDNRHWCQGFGELTGGVHLAISVAFHRWDEPEEFSMPGPTIGFGRPSRRVDAAYMAARSARFGH